MNVVPATRILPARGLVDMLGATMKFTVPLPVPVPPDDTVMKPGSLLTAVQSHPAPAVTFTVSAPPAAVNDRVDGVLEYVQLPVVPFREIESR